MTNGVFYIKRGDRSPNIEYTLSPNVNLTGATIVFNMMDDTGYVVINRGTAAIVGAPVDGVVSYTWQLGDTDNAGNFRAEFEVVYAVSSIPETFPNHGYIAVVIDDDIA